MSPGEVMVIEATDRGSRSDISAWARDTGVQRPGEVGWLQDIHARVLVLRWHGGVHVAALRADPLDAGRHNHQLPTPIGDRLHVELCTLRMTDYGDDLLCWATVATTSILPH